GVAEVLDILVAIFYSVDPLCAPASILVWTLRLGMIGAEELVIAIVMALHWRGMRTEWLMHDGRNQKPRNHRSIGIAGDDLGRDNLFCHYDHLFGGAHGFKHHAEISPTMG